MSAKSMDIVKKLIRYVTRGFCDLRSILVMDALLVHSVLNDDDLAQLLGIQRKELRAICSRLKEDHLLIDHIQKEEGPGQRPINKTYYYIHYTETIDAIKWKMHSIVNKLKEEMGNNAQPQGYICDTCKSRYTTIEAVAIFNPDRNGFVCDLCGSLLREDDNSAQSQANQERLGDLMTQIQPIIDTLKQIDDVVVPENTFQSSLAEAVPVPQATQPGQIPATGVNKTSTSGGLSVAKGRENINGASSLTVNITSDQESAEMEQRAKDEKARMAEENALPAWHVESTVGKTLNDKTADEEQKVKKEEEEDTSQAEEDKQQNVTTASTDENTNNDTAEDKANEEALAAYYATLAKQQEEEEEEEEDDDEEEEEDDDGEFEDVDMEEVETNKKDENEPDTNDNNNNTGGVEVEEVEFDDDDDEE